MIIDLLLASSDVSSGSPLTFIHIALFIFIAIFVGMLIWVLLAKRGAFNKVARIPLEDDKVVTPRGEPGANQKTDERTGANVMTTMNPSPPKHIEDPVQIKPEVRWSHHDEHPPLDEYDKLLNHNYDGIQEYDNPLPGWWVWLFWLSIIFSAGYWMYYHIGVGPSLEDKYDRAVVAHVERQLAQLGDLRADNETIIRFMNDEQYMRAMGGVFRAQCAQCHGADGGGLIGPNLADEFFKNVREPSDIFKVIRDGAANGNMPAFADRMREPQMILIAAYVASLRGTEPAAPRAPEGVRIAPWPIFDDVQLSQDSN